MEKRLSLLTLRLAVNTNMKKNGEISNRTARVRAVGRNQSVGNAVLAAKG